jgi:hypothetical protein
MKILSNDGMALMVALFDDYNLHCKRVADDGTSGIAKLERAEAGAHR